MSRARFDMVVHTIGKPAHIAYQVLFRDGRAEVYGDTAQPGGAHRASVYFLATGVYGEIHDAVIQMALDWNARQNWNPWLADSLSGTPTGRGGCTFILYCGESKDFIRQDLHASSARGPLNPLGLNVMALFGLKYVNYVDVHSLEDPYIKRIPVYPNMGGDQFERALQFGYEFCCEEYRHVGSTALYMTKGMAANVAYEFYAYTTLHPDFLAHNPEWFTDHAIWTARLREAGIRVPPGIVTQAAVNYWLIEGHKRYPDTLGRV